MSSPSRLLVIGLGNPLLSDDGVGWHVAEELRARLPNTISNKTPGSPEEALEIDMLSGGGLSLMERLVGYDRAILIDAMQSGGAPGTIRVFRLEELENPFAGHLGSTHETNLQTALEIGRQLGAHLPPPGAISVVAIEAQTIYDFSEKLSPQVATAVPLAVEAILQWLNYLPP